MRRVRPMRAHEPIPPFRAVIALGDDDPNNQSGELARCLLNCPKVARVDVLVRPWHPHLAELRQLAEACPDRLEVLSEPGEAPSRIARCHFAVTAGNSVAVVALLRRDGQYGPMTHCPGWAGSSPRQNSDHSSRNSARER